MGNKRSTDRGPKILENRLAEFYLKTDFAALEHRGVSLREFLSSWYFHFYNRPKSRLSAFFQRGICSVAKILLQYKDVSLGSSKAVFNIDAERKNDCRFVVVSVYPENHRAFPILDGVISRLPREDVLIVTDNPELAAVYERRCFSIVLVESFRNYATPSIFRPSNPRTFWELRALLVLSKACAHLDLANEVLDRVKPEIVLTCCDLHSFERAFAEAATLRGVCTVTHQHGQIAPTNPQWKFVSSKHMVCWGESTKKHLESILETTEIRVFGTDLYRGLDRIRKNRSREPTAITLALNPRKNRLNDHVLSVFFAALPSIYGLEALDQVIIKLHPDMDVVFWKNRIQSIYKPDRSQFDYLILNDQKEKVLEQTKMLVTLSSSLVLEAYVAGAAVVVLDLGEQFIYSQIYLENLRESYVAPELLAWEIERRCLDDSYFESIINKQDINLASYIGSFNSAVTEAKWLGELA